MSGEVGDARKRNQERTTPTPASVLSEADGDALTRAWLDSDVTQGIEWLTPTIEAIVRIHVAAALTEVERRIKDVDLVLLGHGAAFDATEALHIIHTHRDGDPR